MRDSSSSGFLLISSDLSKRRAMLLAGTRSESGTPGVITSEAGDICVMNRECFPLSCQAVPPVGIVFTFNGR